MDPVGLLDGLRKDAERSLFRARNGIRYATGISQPQVGLSPKRAVWTRDKATLWRYDSDRRTIRRPLLISFSIMGRPYVLDLRPGNSFVERLLAAGFDVFLLDFGVPDDLDAGNTLETYVDAYLRAPSGRRRGRRAPRTWTCSGTASAASWPPSPSPATPACRWPTSP